MNTEPAILLSQSEVASLLTYDECITAVEEAFRLHGNGKALPPAILGVHAAQGGFHIKAGILKLGKNYFVAKANANFPMNRKRYGLPAIQGVTIVSDADNGRLLALTDSIEITILRTGAATAVAAKYLSREDSKSVTIVGCGNQGRISLKMLMKIRPIKTVWVYDIESTVAEKFAEELSAQWAVNILVADDPEKAVSQTDICVTCTPSRQPFVRLEWLRSGTFLAAVGADSEEKQELESSILAVSKLVTDITEQCAAIGELHHALDAGLVTRSHVYAELGEIVAGRKPGRCSPEEMIIFDSTGMALQDVAATVVVYEKAVRNGMGLKMSFMN